MNRKLLKSNAKSNKDSKERLGRYYEILDVIVNQINWLIYEAREIVEKIVES